SLPEQDLPQRAFADALGCQLLLFDLVHGFDPPLERELKTRQQRIVGRISRVYQQDVSCVANQDPYAAEQSLGRRVDRRILLIAGALRPDATLEVEGEAIGRGTPP